MSTPLRDLSKQFEDKDFVKAYFRGVEDGRDVTQRLNRDGATLNSPDLIARLVGWLEEAEPSDEPAADAQARAEQEVSVLNLPSQQKEEKGSESSSSTPSGEESSDGTSRENTTISPTTTSKSTKPSSSFELGGK